MWRFLKHIRHLYTLVPIYEQIKRALSIMHYLDSINTCPVTSATHTYMHFVSIVWHKWTHTQLNSVVHSESCLYEAEPPGGDSGSVTWEHLLSLTHGGLYRTPPPYRGCLRRIAAAPWTAPLRRSVQSSSAVQRLSDCLQSHTHSVFAVYAQGVLDFREKSSIILLIKLSNKIYPPVKKSFRLNIFNRSPQASLIWL